MKTLHTAWIAVIVIFGLHGRARANILDIFFLAGQSNASGRVTTGYAPDPRDTLVQYYYRTDGPPPNDVTSGGTFTTLQPLGSGYYGPEISAGRSLVDLGLDPVIIKISDGSTTLALDWNSTVPGVWWDHWRTDVQDALGDLVAAGNSVRLQGFFWLQGESDDTASEANAYQSNFLNFTNDVTLHLSGLGYDTSKFGFITALIQDRGGFNSIVRSAQQTVMDSMANGSWFDTNDLSVFDGVHFDPASVATIGERFVTTYSLLLLPEPSTVTLFVWSAMMVGMGRRRDRSRSRHDRAANALRPGRARPRVS